MPDKSFGGAARGAGRESRDTGGWGGSVNKRGSRRAAPVEKDMWGRPKGKHADKGKDKGKKGGWW